MQWIAIAVSVREIIIVRKASSSVINMVKRKQEHRRIISNMQEKKSKLQYGFTLIELLVSITIFLILVAITFVSYKAVNQRARDGRRQADLEQIRGALEIYRYDNPTTGYPAGDWAVLSVLTGSPRYISSLPTDPKSSQYTYYYSSAGGTSYVLCGYLEAGGSDSCGDCDASGASPIPCNYQVTSP